MPRPMEISPTRPEAPWPRFRKSPPGWARGVTLAITLLLVYHPVWHGKPVWDDDAHLTKPGLRSPEGLARIWTEPGATQQYYPLTHSLFWMEHRILGEETTGCHLLSISLHAVSAILLAILLGRLGCRAAWFAAAIWALHPIQVESVAWMSELKNTLSGFFYLGAALAFLAHSPPRIAEAGRVEPGDGAGSRRFAFYLLALILFLCGLMSKSTVATLPVSLLIVLLWKEGLPRWRRRILTLIPFLAIGLASGLFTAWMEQTYVIGDAGHPVAASGFPHLTVADRLLLSGRTFWFYLGKLCWPNPLMFIYPRWHPDPSVWSQWLYPAGAAALTVILFRFRRRLGLPPLIALLCYAAALFPAMGFITIYPFRFSFVADHFQYLAGIAPVALAAAGMSLGSARVTALLPARWKTILPPFAGALLLLSLGLASHALCRQYADAETLWSCTLEKNLDCTLALNNLGNLLADQGKTEEAIRLLERAAQTDPEFGEVRCNLAAALLDRNGPGDPGRAWELLQQARVVTPKFGQVPLNFARLHLIEGDPGKSLDEDRKAMALMPGSAAPHLAVAALLSRGGDWGGALPEYRVAVRLEPENAAAWTGLGSSLLAEGHTAEAEQALREALRLDPARATARNNLGIALLRLEKREAAVREFREAVRLEPTNARFQRNLRNTLGTPGLPGGSPLNPPEHAP